ncbi:MAG: rRNA pseudouridine synthase [Deltaproteobacteria bacterium]|nr:rRNA pseudouridine synthase [Deltaproteobacteria bacterium]
MAKERLQKVLARAGVASRRGAEQLIDAGRVRVNGHVVREQGVTVDFRDAVELDGRRVVAEKPVYYLLHKPRRVITSLDDPEGRETVAHLLKGVTARVFPVGRLDYHTSGALMLTNDGALADALLRPKSAVPKVYVAKVPGDVDAEALGALTQGVTLDDGRRTRPAEVVVMRYDAGHSWLRLTLTEGRNRQVHRMLEAIGKDVHRLARISFADLNTDGLRPGQFRPLKAKELERLQKRWGKGAPEPWPEAPDQDPEADMGQVEPPRGRAAARGGAKRSGGKTTSARGAKRSGGKTTSARGGARKLASAGSGKSSAAARKAASAVSAKPTRGRAGAKKNAAAKKPRRRG